jgi:nitrous oxidase accessory protein NosD
MARSPGSLAVAVAALMLMSVGWASAAQADSPEVVGPGDSIQAAVDAADPGDTLLVFGKHRENVVIQTDGLTVRGAGAVILPPATPAAHACFDPTVEVEAVHGICVSGDVDFETGEVSRVVADVTVSGVTVRGFTGSGLVANAARDVTFKGNVSIDNGESGIGAIIATGTRFLFNRAAGNEQAGFSVSSSPMADATLLANEAEGSRFGVSILDALHGRIIANSVHDNCVGVFALASAAGTSGEFHMAANRISRNSRACVADELFPALSGAGVALVGAAGNALIANMITGNAPAGDSAVSGGVVVVASPDGTPPTDNLVARNSIIRNDPDIFWDQTGTGNVFQHNRCRTGTPPRLCP